MEALTRVAADDGRSDAQLMAAVARGEAGAFAALVERHSNALYRLAHRIMGRASEAEDVVQDVLVKVWTHPGAWHPSQGGLPAWLRRVTTNRCLDLLRRRRFVSDAAIPERIDEGLGPEAALGASHLARLATDAVQSLSPRQRAAIVLTYHEELSNIDAARALDMNVKAFESLLVRARAALRQFLEKAGFDAADLAEARR